MISSVAVGGGVAVLQYIYNITIKQFKCEERECLGLMRSRPDHLVVARQKQQLDSFYKQKIIASLMIK